MKGTKQQKGITLVALIITIVVLLILAAVAINSIGETGIIAHAENSAGKYNNSVTNETGILGTYEDFLSIASCEQHVWNPETGKCNNCPTFCTHNWGAYVEVTTMSCITYTDKVEERTCNQCGKKESQTTPWRHESQFCTVCGEECYHNDRIDMIDSQTVAMVKNGYHTHCFSEDCMRCDVTFMNASPDLPACAYYMDENGNCTICGGTVEHNWSGQPDADNFCWGCELQCNSGKTFYYNGNGTHMAWFKCDVCGADGQCGPEEECTMENGKCTVCGWIP